MTTAETATQVDFDPADPVALARALIACPSVTPREGGALSLLDAILSREGFAVARPVFGAPDTADVENLFARHGEGGPHLVLAGHTDVVPPGDEETWRHPPFAAVVEGGALFGRGAVDMKGGLAAMVAAAVRTVRRGGTRNGLLSFVVTGDEEGPSVNGTAKLLAWCAARGERFDAAVVGEPTCRAVLGDTIKVGRRGALSGRVEVAGVQGHAAYPEKARNPIPPLLAVAAALIAPPFDDGTPHFQPTNLEIVSMDVGNPAYNVIPARAELKFNVRFNDRWSVDTLSAEIERRVAAAAPGAAVDLSLFRPSDVFLTEAAGLVEPLARAIEAVTGLAPERTTGGGTSDARHIKDYCPVVEFGLVGETMHQVDERVPVDDLTRLAAIYERFMEDWFGAAR